MQSSKDILQVVETLVARLVAELHTHILQLDVIILLGSLGSATVAGVEGGVTQWTTGSDVDLLCVSSAWEDMDSQMKSLYTVVRALLSVCYLCKLKSLSAYYSVDHNATTHTNHDAFAQDHPLHQSADGAQVRHSVRPTHARLQSILARLGMCAYAVVYTGVEVRRGVESGHCVPD
jgi:hypothetical protein